VHTNDVEHAGDRGMVFGALLTPKGMIVTDLWSARTDDEVLAIVPAEGREPALQIFQRYFPPRLARTEDRSDGTGVFTLLGPTAPNVLAQMGIELPDTGSAAAAVIGGAECHLLRPHQAAPFAALLTCPRGSIDEVRGVLQGGGLHPLPPAARHLPRILAGWPELGAEIGAKTLPQEVRFDDLEGVSYTKGCYTGQETVARVHFRGRPNRHLVGMVWREAPDPNDASVSSDGKPVGRVTSVAWSAAWELWIGIAMIRREIAVGSALLAAGAEARVVSFPVPRP
jgi:folate-binding protein YgfZ